MNEPEQEIETGIKEKEEKKDKRTQDQKFWDNPKYIQVFRKLVSGASLEAIARDLGISDKRIGFLITHPSFNRRLRDWINTQLFDFQIKSLLELPKIYQLLKEEFEKRLKLASNDTIVREFLRFYSTRPDKKNIYPDLINIVFNVWDKHPKKSVGSIGEELRLREVFGYKPLALPEEKTKNVNSSTIYRKSEEERKSGDSQMDRGKQTEEQQG